MTGMSDKQVLEHFQEAFQLKIEVQLLEIDGTNIAISRTRALTLLFKLELLQPTSSSMLL